MGGADRSSEPARYRRAADAHADVLVRASARDLGQVDREDARIARHGRCHLHLRLCLHRDPQGGSMTLISFPEVVDERAARAVAAGVVALSLAAIATRSVLVVGVLAIGFVLRVLTGPRFSPL